MMSKYTESFPEDLEESDMMKSVIDYKFEKETRPFFLKQLAMYLLTFVIPFFVVAYVEVNGSL